MMLEGSVRVQTWCRLQIIKMVLIADWPAEGSLGEILNVPLAESS
jgi:hypothetical protein